MVQAVAGSSPVAHPSREALQQAKNLSWSQFKRAEPWANRDFSAHPEVAQPDLLLDVSRRVVNPAVYRGLDGFQRFVRDVDEIWEGFRFDPEELIDAGDHVVASARISGRGRGSGIETEMVEFSLWTVREGKVSSTIGGFRHRADALEAAGLSE